MRIVFIATFLLNLLFTVAAMLVGPSTVAIHFGSGGEPNGWAPAHVNALIMAGVNALVFVAFAFTPQLLRVTPSRWINLPNKAFWLKDENKPKMESMLSSQLYEYGALTFVFLFVIGLLALQANLSDPVRLREDLFWWPFGLYMVYSVYWCVKLARMFRLPKGE